MDKKDKQLEGLVSAQVAYELASRAFDMAKEAMIELEAMKKSTHKTVVVDPYKDLIPQDKGPLGRPTVTAFSQSENDMNKEIDKGMDLDPMGEYE